MTRRHVASLQCALLALAAFLYATWTRATSADAAKEAVEGWFVQVKSLDALTDNGLYVIGANSWDGKFFLLSREKSSDGKKLRGVREATPPGQPIQSPDAAVVWRFTRVATNRFSLSTHDGGSLMYVPEDKETDIKLAEDKATVWAASCNGDGTFNLANPQEDRRFLALYSIADNVSWGNYTKGGADAIDLRIYRFTTDAAEFPGEASLPDDGCRVALYGNGRMGTTDGGGCLSAADASPFLLTNGTAAPGAAGTWTCRHAADDGAFFLENADGRFLGHDLGTGTEASPWEVRNGHITAKETREKPRRLLFDTASGNFVLKEEAGETCRPVVFLPVGADPDSATTDGTKRLTGAWNALRLAALDWDNVCRLDLSGISLPISARGFANRPDDRHTIIYVNRDNAESVPPDWVFTVCQDGDERYLLTDTEIKEGLPLPATLPFNYGAGKLSYTRAMQTDGGWETLFLPFATDVPEGCIAASPTGYAEGKLSFAPLRTIPACTAAIIRPADKESETAETTFRSLAGTFTGESREEGIFRGTFTRYTVDSDRANVFLLNAEGDAFVRAAAGSHLQPFRAALLLPDNRRNALALPPIEAEAARQEESGSPITPCYTIDGRRVAGSPDAEALKRLPAGLYIVGGKKIVK